MTDVIEALKEWRNAREAFFKAAAEDKGMVPPENWKRLAKAEHALMGIARMLP